MDEEKKDKTVTETVIAEETTPAEPSAEEEAAVREEAEPTPEKTPEGDGGEETGAGKGGGRSRWEELADRYADQNVESEDEAFDVIEDELESLSAFKRDELAANERLIDTLNAEPDFKEFVGYMLQGASFREALARTIDIETLTPAEGDPDRAAWDKAKEERIGRLKQMEDEDRVNRERVVKIAQNTDETKALIDAFAEEHRMSGEEKTEMMGKLAALASDILIMKVSRDVLDMILKSIRMDKIIEDAKEEGAVGERNRKIEVMRMSKGDSDGLPSLDAGAGEVEKPEKEGLSGFFDDVFKKRGIN